MKINPLLILLQIVAVIVALPFAVVFSALFVLAYVVGTGLNVLDRLGVFGKNR